MQGPIIVSAMSGIGQGSQQTPDPVMKQLGITLPNGKKEITLTTEQLDDLSINGLLPESLDTAYGGGLFDSLPTRLVASYTPVTVSRVGGQETIEKTVKFDGRLDAVQYHVKNRSFMLDFHDLKIINQGNAQICDGSDFRLDLNPKYRRSVHLKTAKSQIDTTKILQLLEPDGKSSGDKIKLSYDMMRTLFQTGSEAVLPQPLQIAFEYSMHPGSDIRLQAKHDGKDVILDGTWNVFFDKKKEAFIIELDNVQAVESGNLTINIGGTWNMNLDDLSEVEILRQPGMNQSTGLTGQVILPFKQ